MATRTPIKKNDQVYILAGKDRGKTGRVLIVHPKDSKVVVEGVQIIKRHTKPNPQRNIKGGIVEKESAIDLSNVALICKSCGKRSRLGSQVLSDGRRVRSCKKCGNTID